MIQYKGTNLDRDFLGDIGKLGDLQKVTTIKVVRRLLGSSLREAKKIVEYAILVYQTEKAGLELSVWLRGDANTGEPSLGDILSHILDNQNS
jgi:hypothetical protein